MLRVQQSVRGQGEEEDAATAIRDVYSLKTVYETALPLLHKLFLLFCISNTFVFFCFENMGK